MVTQDFHDGGILVREDVPSSDVVRERFGFLDGLRAVAIVAVVIALTAKHYEYLAEGQPALKAAIHLLSHGLDAFFLISGFALAYPVLTVMHQDGRTYLDVARFALKRVIRILPAYYVAIGLTVLVPYLASRFALGSLSGTLPTTGDIVKQALFAGNALQNDGFWSLALTVRWYVLFPFLLVLFVRWPIAFAVLGLGAYGLNLLTPLHGIDVWALLPFMLGIVAADMRAQGSRIERFGLPLALVAGIGAVFAEPALASLPLSHAAGEPFFVVNPVWDVAIFFFIVGAGYVSLVDRVLGWRVLGLLAGASYATSLVADPVVGFVMHQLTPLLSPDSAALNAAALALVMGVILWQLVDRWFIDADLRPKLVDLLAPFLGAALAPLKLARIPFESSRPGVGLAVPMDLENEGEPTGFYAPPPRTTGADLAIVMQRTGSPEQLAAEILETKKRLAEQSAALFADPPEPPPPPPPREPERAPGFYENGYRSAVPPPLDTVASTDDDPFVAQATPGLTGYEIAPDPSFDPWAYSATGSASATSAPPPPPPPPAAPPAPLAAAYPATPTGYSAPTYEPAPSESVYEAPPPAGVYEAHPSAAARLEDHAPLEAMPPEPLPPEPPPGAWLTPPSAWTPSPAQAPLSVPPAAPAAELYSPELYAPQSYSPAAPPPPAQSYAPPAPPEPQPYAPPAPQPPQSYAPPAPAPESQAYAPAPEPQAYAPAPPREPQDYTPPEPQDYTPPASSSYRPEARVAEQPYAPPAPMPPPPVQPQAYAPPASPPQPYSPVARVAEQPYAPPAPPTQPQAYTPPAPPQEPQAYTQPEPQAYAPPAPPPEPQAYTVPAPPQQSYAPEASRIAEPPAEASPAAPEPIVMPPSAWTPEPAPRPAAPPAPIAMPPAAPIAMPPAAPTAPPPAAPLQPVASQPMPMPPQAATPPIAMPPPAATPPLAMPAPAAEPVASQPAPIPPPIAMQPPPASPPRPSPFYVPEGISFSVTSPKSDPTPAPPIAMSPPPAAPPLPMPAPPAAAQQPPPPIAMPPQAPPPPPVSAAPPAPAPPIVTQAPPPSAPAALEPVEETLQPWEMPLESVIHIATDEGGAGQEVSAPLVAEGSASNLPVPRNAVPGQRVSITLRPARPPIKVRIGPAATSPSQQPNATPNGKPYALDDVIDG